MICWTLWRRDSALAPIETLQQRVRSEELAAKPRSEAGWHQWQKGWLLSRNSDYSYVTKFITHLYLTCAALLECLLPTSVLFMVTIFVFLYRPRKSYAARGLLSVDGYKPLVCEGWSQRVDSFTIYHGVLQSRHGHIIYRLRGYCFIFDQMSVWSSLFTLSNTLPMEAKAMKDLNLEPRWTQQSSKRVRSAAMENDLGEI
jgi:hypothetical protein